MSGLESQLPILLLFLASASVLAVITERWLRAPYTVAIAVVGLVFGTLGITGPVELSHDLIIFILLPALLFEGAAAIEFHELKKVLPAVLGVALVGLSIQIAVIGVASEILFGFPLTVALLFGVIRISRRKPMALAMGGSRHTGKQTTGRRLSDSPTPT